MRGGGVALLTADEEWVLAAAAKAGDKAATERLVEAFDPLAAKAARCYRGRGVPWDDLVQEARLGILEAIPHFMPERGRFSTCAWWWMRARLTRCFNTHGRLVRLSHYRAEQVTTARAIWERGGEAVDVALALDVSEDVADGILEEASRETSRLDAPREFHPKSDGDSFSATLHDVVSEGDLTPLPSREAGNFAAYILRPHVARLELQERQVLTLRYGLGDEGAVSLKETGQRLGLTEREVWTIEKRAIRHLRGLSKSSPFHRLFGNMSVLIQKWAM